MRSSCMRIMLNHKRNPLGLLLCQLLIMLLRRFRWDHQLTSSNALNMSMLGWCIVQTAVLLVSTVFRTTHIMTAATHASSPDVGSSMKIVEGFATSSTAMVKRFLGYVDKPVLPRMPTKACLRVSSSTRLITSSTNS